MIKTPYICSIPWTCNWYDPWSVPTKLETRQVYLPASLKLAEPTVYQEDIALNMLLPLWDHWYWGEVAGEEQDSLVLAPNPIVAEFNPESVMVTGDG